MSNINQMGGSTKPAFFHVHTNAGIGPF